MKIFTSLLRIGWLLLTILAIVAIIQPVNAKLIRWFICLAIPVILAGASLLLWKRRRLRWVPMIPLILGVGVLLAPAGKVDWEGLRAEYCLQLRSYEGATYLWGGESHKGIDCSGLVRQGLLRANLNEGLRSANGTLLKTAFALWWSDFPAKALLDPDRNLARTLFQAESINRLNYDSLLAGDLAVTANGVHVLAYLGEGEWIEADPGIGKVVRVPTPVEANVWFEKPVVLVRWRILDERE